MQQAVDILKSSRLKKTPGRVEILGVFIDNQHIGLTESDLEGLLKTKPDRATIYRTLNTFVEAEILHTVADELGKRRYALCSTLCAHDHDHNNSHVHFKCAQCDTIECLDDQAIGHINLPEGYTANSANYLILGTCKNCNKN